LHLLVIDDWAIAIGSSIFIIFCINSNTVRSIMLLKPVHYVGKISYSLYLYHMIIMFTMINVFYGKFPISVILISSFVISFIVASTMYYLIEKPSMRLGRLLVSSRSPLEKSAISNRASVS
jgi:peptidoglycan/LPS O-acetylase OafA/YrhL